ncbi:hypothetical protein CB0940_05381 [Cercospora beticola]|uniref:Uncharacterized protein n=1 Tax=Cercospora beticola TaxID=122368 RepID=A0A2G5HYK3_CERBT|nr:hypothetical protein CB0940_05381 [Cercospora beticola]PIA97571.1 hypothetical protein CB0940_05381 [Cercospora beticola]WPA97921.1 hypothetical protein RHO25_002532 [Cercospora beticola]CAK1359121.1 unnamed protein product [Cercospora beticola]
MQFKLVAATVASLALSGVLAVPTENIVAREINAQNAEMSQLVTKAKQAGDSEAEIFNKFGAEFKQAYETNFGADKLANAKIPTMEDWKQLKANALAKQQQQQGATQSTNNKDSNSIQQRDAEANAQCWPNCGGSWLNWPFANGCQSFLPYWGYADYWDHNPLNWLTCWGAYPLGGYNWGSYYASGGIGINANLGLGGLNVGLGLGINL